MVRWRFPQGGVAGGEKEQTKMNGKSASIGMAAVLVVGGGTASGQVAFSDVAVSTGLDFVTVHGATFDMDDLGAPGPVVTQLQMVQRNMGHGAAVGDYDDDGDLDVYILGGLGERNVLFENQLELGTLQFVDVTATAELENLGLSRVAQFVDLDNDGDRDLILLNDSDPGGVHPRSVIYSNDGDGTFSDVTPGSGFTPVGYIKGGLGVVDYDQDGRLDIWVSNWGALQGAGFTWMPGQNRLYRNLGDFQFEDVTTAAGFGTIESNSFTPLFVDFDNDGDADVYIAVDGYQDYFFRNDGGTYTDVTTTVGATHVGTDMGAIIHDFDLDGDLDFYTTNVTPPDNSYGGNTLMVNQLVETGSLSFVDEADTRGVFNTGWGWGTEWIDCNNGGYKELYAVNGFDEFVAISQPPDYADYMIDLRAFLFTDYTSGNFAELPATGADVIGDARAAIKFDADRDGLQDLLVTNIEGPVVLLKNEAVSSGHWLTVKLEAGGPVNREAVGARVTMMVGGQTLVQEMLGGGSYLSGRPFEMHFGVNAYATIDELRVDWPGGYQNVATNVATDTVWTGVFTLPYDLNGDFIVGFAELSALLAAWGPCVGECPADFDGDGQVAFSDLSSLLNNWTVLQK